MSWVVDLFPLSWELRHPNWRTHIFHWGRYTTNQCGWGTLINFETNFCSRNWNQEWFRPPHIVGFGECATTQLQKKRKDSQSLPCLLVKFWAISQQKKTWSIRFLAFPHFQAVNSPFGRNSGFWPPKMMWRAVPYALSAGAPLEELYRGCLRINHSVLGHLAMVTQFPIWLGPAWKPKINTLW